MAFYPAFFEDGEGGHVVVSFPDLPGCFTQGDTVADAMRMAMDALNGHILTLNHRRPLFHSDSYEHVSDTESCQ